MPLTREEVQQLPLKTTLERLIEECCELGHACCKALRYGLTGTNPYTFVRNADQIQKEFEQIRDLIENLQRKSYTVIGDRASTDRCSICGELVRDCKTPDKQTLRCPVPYPAVEQRCAQCGMLTKYCNCFKKKKETDYVI